MKGFQMRSGLFLAAVCVAMTACAADQKIMDIRPAKTTDSVLTGVEWENANEANLSAQTGHDKLSAFVADERSAEALLAQLLGAYRTDPLVARQIAAVSQWVMLPDPWYCLLWDGKHAAGRKVWIEALLSRAEKSSDGYIKEFCLDQMRWCGCDCPAQLERIRKIGQTSGDKAVLQFADVVVRELEKRSVGLPGAVDARAELPKPVGTSVYGMPDDEGFVCLFNGRDLTGWFGSPSYGVEVLKRRLDDGTETSEGVMACFPERRVAGDHGNLATVLQYENFILRFEFMMPENGNNGLGIRASCEYKDSAYFGMCELQLLDDGGSEFYDSSCKTDRLRPYQYTGSVYGVVPSRRDNALKRDLRDGKEFAAGGSYLYRPGLWNFEEVRVVGSEIEVYLNGHLITRADVSKFKGDGDTPDKRAHPGLHNKKGHLVWCGHGSNVKWRNIRIKELPADAKMSGVAAPRDARH